MSLESYKNVLETQREREREIEREREREREKYFGYEPPKPTNSDAESRYYEEDKSKKSSSSKIVMTVIVIAVLLLAALKNPSKSEARAEVAAMIVEKFNDHMREEITSEDDSSGEKIGSAFAMLIAPALIEKWVQTDVSNYIFFSTFDSNVTVENETKTIVSGIIVFGVVIPLHTGF